MPDHDDHAAPVTVTLHLVTSLDGFIASRDGSVGWLDSPDDAYPAGISLAEDEITRVLASIDCYVMGARTYEHACTLGWPYGDKPVVVLSHRELPSDRQSVSFHEGDPERLVRDVLAPRHPRIWLVGGALLAQDFLRRDLVDRIVLTTAPVTLGGGLRLFTDDGPAQRWRLEDVVGYRNGFVELTYARIDP